MTNVNTLIMVTHTLTNANANANVKCEQSFNQSDITALALMLSVNCPLIRSRIHLIFDASSNASVNTDSDTWYEWYFSNQCSPSQQQGTWGR